MSAAGTLKCCDLAASQTQRMQLPGTTPSWKKQLWKSADFPKLQFKKILPLECPNKGEAI